MEKKFAIIQDSKVVQVVIWDGKSTWDHEGEAVELKPPAGIGWDYDGKNFTDNRPDEEE